MGFKGGERLALMLPPGSCSSEMPLPLRYSCARLGRQAPSCATSAQRTPLWFSTSTDSGRLAARPGAGCSRLAVRFRAVSLGSAREMASTSAQLDSRLPLRSSSSSSGARAARAAGSPCHYFTADVSLHWGSKGEIGRAHV